jgi:hypothetical protein
MSKRSDYLHRTGWKSWGRGRKKDREPEPEEPIDKEKRLRAKLLRDERELSEFYATRTQEGPLARRDLPYRPGGLATPPEGPERLSTQALLARVAIPPRSKHHLERLGAVGTQRNTHQSSPET